MGTHFCHLLFLVSCSFSAPSSHSLLPLPSPAHCKGVWVEAPWPGGSPGPQPDECPLQPTAGCSTAVLRKPLLSIFRKVFFPPVFVVVVFFFFFKGVISSFPFSFSLCFLPSFLSLGTFSFSDFFLWQPCFEPLCFGSDVLSWPLSLSFSFHVVFLSFSCSGVQ